MKKAPAGEDIQSIQTALLKWYDTCRRSLPWRKTRDPYRIWVSEVMLQQTQVATVIPYYKRFIRIFPNVKTLSRSDLQDVLKAWEGLGYYARARNLHRAANHVMSEHGGRIPSEPEKLIRLPGIGKYIAAALTSIAFNQPQAVVDGNVKRVLSRFYMMDAPINVSSSNPLFEQLAKYMLDPMRPGDFNQALMELGARICKPRNPACVSCPVSPFCKATAHQQVGQYPKRRMQPQIPSYAVVIGVIFRRGRTLIVRRKDNGLLGGLWEFPGGKIQPGETPEEACLREIREESTLTVAVEEYLTRIRHGYTHFKIVADVFVCRYLSGRVRLSGATAYRWIKVHELDRYPFPGANRKFIPMLKSLDL